MLNNYFLIILAFCSIEAESELKKSGPPCWQKMSDQEKDITLVAKWTMFGSSKGVDAPPVLSRTIQYQNSSRLRAARFDMDYSSGRQYRHIQRFNNIGGSKFTVNRTNVEEDWQLTSAGGSSESQVDPTTEKYVNGLLRVRWQIGGVTAEQIVNSQGARFRYMDSEKEIVEVSFDSFGLIPGLSGRRFEIHFNKKYAWAIVGFRHSGSGSVITQNNIYAPVIIEGSYAPTPQRILFKSDITHKNAGDNVHYEIETFGPFTGDAEIFSERQFQIASVAPKQPTSVWIYVLYGGIVLLLIVVIWATRRRLKANDSQSES